MEIIRYKEECKKQWDLFIDKCFNNSFLFKRDYMDYDLSQLDHKFVKIVVINRQDLFTFDTFVDKIQNRKIHELKISENFNEFIGENVEDEAISLEDTTELLDSYVDAVDTELDKDRLKSNMRNLLSEAQALEIV